MVIRNYGVQLRSIVQSDLEIIRRWRNSDSVRNHMINQLLISPAKQEKWFAELGENNLYFMIEEEENQMGIIHIKDIQFNPKIAEAGIFIGEKKYRKTHWPIAAILALMDTCFDPLNFQFLFAKTKKNNPKVLALNLALGYEIYREFDDYFLLKVEPQSYLEKSSPLKTQLGKWIKKDEPLLNLSHSEKEIYL